MEISGYNICKKYMSFQNPDVLKEKAAHEMAGDLPFLSDEIADFYEANRILGYYFEIERGMRNLGSKRLFDKVRQDKPSK